MYLESKEHQIESAVAKLVAVLDGFENVGARAQIERALILPHTEKVRPWDEHGDGSGMESRVWCARMMPLLLNSSLMKSPGYPSLNAGLRTSNVIGVLTALYQIVTGTLPPSGNLGPHEPGPPLV